MSERTHLTLVESPTEFDLTYQCIVEDLADRLRKGHESVPLSVAVRAVEELRSSALDTV